MTLSPLAITAANCATAAELAAYRGLTNSEQFAFYVIAGDTQRSRKIAEPIDHEIAASVVTSYPEIGHAGLIRAAFNELAQHAEEAANDW